MYVVSPMQIHNGRYYDVLGVPKTASVDDVKKAYEKAAQENHPDIGGDVKKFKEIAQAFTILSDTEKRNTYDQHGEDALKERMGGGVLDPFKIYETVFSEILFGGRSRKGKKTRMGQNMTIPLEVTLEDLYFGTTKKVFVTRNIICRECNGEGVKTKRSKNCAGCKGRGCQFSESRTGKVQVCDECKGSGEKIADEDKCPECNGKKLLPDQKVLEVIVKEGMQNGQEIKFLGIADAAPEKITGNIVIVLQQKEHSTFIRKGDDLFVELKLSLRESLCGFQCVLTHMDGRKLLIKTNPGELVHADSYKAINNEGMPIYQKPSSRGHLYFHFTVNLPKYLSTMQLNTLKTILPPSTASVMKDKELDKWKETTLHDVDNEEEIRECKRACLGQEIY